MTKRSALLAKVHIAKKDLGLDDTTYRAMLQHLVGVESAADCTERQLVLVVAALRRRGWANNRPATSKYPKVRPEYESLLSKINALRLDTGKEWPYVEGIAKKMYGVELPWCDGEQLKGVITALVRHQKRQQRKESR